MQKVSIAYKFGISNGINVEDIRAFEKEVDAIINDEKGWKRYGVYFHKTGKSHLSASSKDRAANSKILSIKLKLNKDILRDTSAQGNALDGFSYYDPNKVEICINKDNWDGKSKGTASDGTWFTNVHDYRKYVIYHELGHHLEHHLNVIQFEQNDGHITVNTTDFKPGDPCPIMVQQTRGKAWCQPTKPNKYPIDADARLLRLISGGDGHNDGLNGNGSFEPCSHGYLTVLVGCLVLFCIVLLVRYLHKNICTQDVIYDPICGIYYRPITFL